MGSRKPKTKEEWQTEASFCVQTENEKRYEFFNRSRACFYCYCKMQAKFALEDGFPNESLRISELTNPF